MSYKAKTKAEWMGNFEDHVCALDPRHTGKIEWPSAEFFYGRGDSAFDAAEKYVENRKDVPVAQVRR